MYGTLDNLQKYRKKLSISSSKTLKALFLLY